MKNKEVPILVLFLLLLAELFAQTSEIDSLENLLHKHSIKDTTRVKLLNSVAYKVYLKDIDKAFKYAKEAEVISTQISYSKGNAQSLVLIGFCYDEKSDFNQALKYYNKALKIYEAINDKTGITNCYNNIGIVYRYQGDYSRAMEFYLKSLEFAEEINDKSGMSYSYNNIGIIYLCQDDYPKALEYYQKSLKIDEELGDKYGISYSLNNIGIIYKYQKDYVKALEFYKKSLMIKEELADKSGMIKTYNNIGGIYKYLHEYSKAYKYYQKSLEINKEVGKESSKATSYIGLSSLFFEQDKIKEADYYAKKAYRLAKKIGDVELIKEGAELLAKISNSLGNYKEAYKYHVVFKQMNDSLYNEKNIKNITGLEFQYKYEKEKKEAELEQQKQEAVRIEKEKRQKIVRNSLIIGFVLMFLLVLVVFFSLLQKRKANQLLTLQKEKIKERNTELFNLNEEIRAQSKKIKETNQNLSVLNATKDKFFSIIAHDLRSPFNALLGLSEILLKMHKEYDIEKREDIIKSINSGVVETYKLLENLLTWSLSQSNRIQFSPEILNLKLLIQETLITLKESANKKNVRIIYTISETETIYADKNMITTILRNLISNSIKFTRNEQQITISAETHKDGRFCEISVADTGVGIPKDKIEDLFCIEKNTSTKGTDNEKGTGLGLILCKEFIEKHGGKIWVESEIDVGTTFSFAVKNKQIVE